MLWTAFDFNSVDYGLSTECCGLLLLLICPWTMDRRLWTNFDFDMSMDRELFLSFVDFDLTVDYGPPTVDLFRFAWGYF